MSIKQEWYLAHQQRFRVRDAIKETIVYHLTQSYQQKFEKKKNKNNSKYSNNEIILKTKCCHVRSK